MGREVPGGLGTASVSRALHHGAGHLWVYLNWALGLRALGCRVLWLEVVDPHEPPETISRKVAALRGHLARYDLADGLALVARPGRRPPGASTDDGGPPHRVDGAVDLERAGGTVDLDRVGGAVGFEHAVEADLLLNLWHSLPEEVVGRFRRSAFVDTDPGLLQIWMTNGEVDLAPHDVYFSIGETVGTPDARFPDCGLPWHYTPPAVFLPAWPYRPPPAGGRYTTVAHWWGGTLTYGGTTILNEKRVSFLEHIDLPRHTATRLELALCLGEYHERYRRLLEPRGWHLREAWDVTATPEAYQDYVQGSRGEFSCAKPGYVALDTAWVSDRTLCYLASGRPAVVQDTGPSRILPQAEGLFRFGDVREAAEALDAAEADYCRHGQAARALAERHFDATRVAAGVLERALAGSA